MQPPSFSSRAIAYLKAQVPPEDESPVVSLSPEDSPVLRSLCNGLLVCYVVDTGDEFEYVQYRRLAEDQIDEDELHNIGLANLTSLVSSSGVRVVPHPNGQMFAVLMGGNFEASLILLDWLWDDSFRQFVSGDYVIGIPARDILCFCDASSADGLMQVRAACERARSGGVDHPISNELYRRVAGKWRVFEP
jgi:hypothetical protein